MRDAERMREVADIICSFPDYLPVVVLSAMGKVRRVFWGMWRKHTGCYSTAALWPHLCIAQQSTNMLLECGDLALVTPVDEIPNLAPLK